MTDELLDDVELTDRVGAAMHRLADSHTPAPATCLGQKRRGRWLLTAAAAAMVALGIGGLVVASRTTGDPSSPVNSGDPAPDSSAPDSDPAIVGSGLRFDAPLGDDIIAAIKPAPSEVSAFRGFPSEVDTFLYGFGDAATVSVLDSDGTTIGLVNVAETPIPPLSFASEELETRNGVVVYRDEQGFPGDILSVEDDVVRRVNAVQSGSDDDAAQARELAIEVAAYVDATPLSELAATDRFLPVPSASVDLPTIIYTDGGNEDVSVMRSVYDAPLTAEQLRAVGTIFGVTEFGPDATRAFGELPQSDQPVYVEQVSPVDVVTVLGVVGTSRDEMEALVDGLVFDTAEVLGITVEYFNGFDDAEIVLQGEESWGRWLITETVSDDERCFGLGATVWPLDTKFASGSDCHPLEDPSPPSICLQMKDGYVTVERRNTATEGEIEGTNVEFRSVDLRVSLNEVQPPDNISCN